MKNLTYLSLILVSVLLFGVSAPPSTSPSSTAFYVHTNYAVTPLSTTSALPIVSAMPYPASSIGVFDTAGIEIVLSVNHAGVVSSFVVPPGGGGFPKSLSKGDSISIIGLTTGATTGVNDTNFYF